MAVDGITGCVLEIELLLDQFNEVSLRAGIRSSCHYLDWVFRIDDWATVELYFGKGANVVTIVGADILLLTDSKELHEEAAAMGVALRSGKTKSR